MNILAFIAVQAVLFIVLMLLMSVIAGAGIAALGLKMIEDESGGGSVVSFMALYGGIIVGFILTLIIQIFLTVRFVYPYFFG